MKDNVAVIKEMIMSLNMVQLIELKNIIDGQVMSSVITSAISSFQKPNIPVAKEVPQYIPTIPENIPPKAEPQKTVWKANSEKWAGRDARRDEEGWTYADKDIELSNFIATAGGSALVNLDDVDFNIKFSGQDNRFLSRSLPKNK